MTEAAENFEPVVYAGRFAERLEEGVLSEWDVLPDRLAEQLGRASGVVLLDLFSFPFELLGGSGWDVPLVASIPGGLDVEQLNQLFGRILFERLTFFDYLHCRDRGVWRKLRRQYNWADCQRLRTESAKLEEVLPVALRSLVDELKPPFDFQTDSYEAVKYWSSRGDSLAASSPHRAICSVQHEALENKRMHRVQAAALGRHFGEFFESHSPEMQHEVLEVGCGVGRWVGSFDPEMTNFTGIDISEAMVKAAKRNYPEHRFNVLGDDLKFPYRSERFDLVFCVTVLHHNTIVAKKRMLQEMLRVLRPGGRLVCLEDFVSPRRKKDSTVYPMSVLEFTELLQEVSGGEVILEHVETLRYAHVDQTRSGLVVLSKIAVPGNW